MNKYIKKAAVLLLTGLLTLGGLLLYSHIYVQGVLDGQLVACNKSLAVNNRAGSLELYCEQRGQITYLRSAVIHNLEIQITSPADLSSR